MIKGVFGYKMGKSQTRRRYLAQERQDRDGLFSETSMVYSSTIDPSSAELDQFLLLKRQLGRLVIGLLALMCYDTQRGCTLV